MSSESEAVEAEWPTDPNSYQLLVQIGKGAFATVWKATIVLGGGGAGGAAKENTPTQASNNAEESSDSASATNRPEQTSSSQQECAIKVLNLDHVDTNLSEIRLEVQAMRLSSHPNILTMHTAFVADTNLWLITPLMRKGSSVHCLQMARKLLRRQARQQQQQQQQQAAALAQETGTAAVPSLPSSSSSARITLPPLQDHILYLLHETVLGLQYIHENGFIHRDVKGGNIFLDGDGSVKIGDFGVSGWLVQGGRQSTKAQTFVGTPCWMAPEVMEQVHGYDTSADIWSLGITALELAKGYAPYAKYPPMKVLILTIQEDPPSLDTYVEDDSATDDYDGVAPEVFARPFVQLVEACLQKVPSRRPTCQELLQRYLPMDEAQRHERRDRIVREICQLVPDVGSSTSHSSRSSSVLNAAKPRAASVADGGSSGGDGDASTTTTPLSIALAAEKDRPPGTTWVFADGNSTSQTAVQASDMVGSQENDGTTALQPLSPLSPTAAAVEDVLEELDEFGKQTGGEHYTRKASNRGQGRTAAGHINSRHPDDDLVLSSLQMPPPLPSHEPPPSSLAPSPQSPPPPPPPQMPSANNNESSEHGDDLSAFMDEFELKTAGEDFRRDEE